MDWIYYITLLALCLTGVVLTALTLPGTWVTVLFTILYGLVTHWKYVGWKSIAVLFVLATVAEVIDTVAGGAGAKKAGASRRAMFGAVVGGLLGAIFLSFIIPIFPIGTIAGACLGCFLGAGLVEMAIRREVGRSVNVGYHAAKGRLLGIISRLLFSLLMLVICAWVALPFRRVGATIAPLPLTTSPTTQ